jgi:hypothetical protein
MILQLSKVTISHIFMKKLFWEHIFYTSVFFFLGWVIALVVRIRVGWILENDLGDQLGQRQGIENQLVEDQSIKNQVQILPQY